VKLIWLLDSGFGRLENTSSNVREDGRRPNPQNTELVLCETGPEVTNGG